MPEKTYYISINETRIQVSEEIYRAYYRAERRIRYYERDIKIETPIRDKDGIVVGYAPSKEDSFERILATGENFADEQESVEDLAIISLMSDKLHEVLDKLTTEERELIDALYFTNGGVGMSEREYAKLSGLPRKTLAYRREKIIGKLKILLNY